MPSKRKIPRSVAAGLRQQAVQGDIRSPDLARLVAAFFKEAGGETAVAKMLHQEFLDSPAGGVTRQRILDMILRATKFTNEKDAPVDDLGTLTEADLDRELSSLIEEVADDYKPDSGPTRKETAQAAGAEAVDQRPPASAPPAIPTPDDPAERPAS